MGAEDLLREAVVSGVGSVRSERDLPAGGGICVLADDPDSPAAMTVAGSSTSGVTPCKAASSWMTGG